MGPPGCEGQAFKVNIFIIKSCSVVNIFIIKSCSVVTGPVVCGSVVCGSVVLWFCSWWVGGNWLINGGRKSHFYPAIGIVHGPVALPPGAPFWVDF